MKQFMLLGMGVCLYLLSGCGSEGLSAGGASLGGSGGTSKPTRPGDHTAETGTEEYQVIAPAITTDDCGGVQRTIQLLDKQTLQPLSPKSVHLLLPITTDDATNTLLQVRISNTNPQAVYEYTTACAAPIQIYDQEQNRLVPNQHLACAKNVQGIQVYQPYEVRDYEFSFHLSPEQKTWQAVYQATYSASELKNVSQQQSCQPLQAALAVELLKPLEHQGKGSDMPTSTDQAKDSAEKPSADKHGKSKIVTAG
jgi:hypothetical protein